MAGRSPPPSSGRWSSSSGRWESSRTARTGTDARTGAAGRWAGPTLTFLPAGLDLAGPLPAEASGGGSGQLTAVFINGRELHPVDVAMMQQLVGQVWPGRWWVDGQGNFGLEGGPPMGNLVSLARS